MNVTVTLTISNMPQQITVELDAGVTIREIFDFVRSNFNIQGNFEQWTCMSKARNYYYTDLNQQLGGAVKQDTLVINTAPNAKLILSQTNRGLSENQSLPSSQQQQYQQPPPSDNVQGKKLTISFNIQDGNVKKTFQSVFSEAASLNDLAMAVQGYCCVSQEVATIDLYINNQPYNAEAKRKMSLLQLQIKDQQSVDAKVRWYGGMI